MATKTTDNRFYVLDEIRGLSCDANPSNQYQNLVGSVVTRTAVFSRPKPRKLEVTPFSYKEVVSRDEQTSDCKRHSYSTGYRSGSLFHCHNSLAGTRRNFDSRPNVSMATTLAKARFTSNSYAETLAESRRTSRMIGNRIGMLGSLAKAIRARDRVRADKLAARMRNEQYAYKTNQGKPISRRFADGWLEYQFGWLPLLSEIYDLVGYYNNRLYQGMQVSRGYSTNGGFSKTSKSSAIDKANRIWDHGAATKVVVRTRVSNPTLRTLSEMGLLNPASLAWDLLPYSFVVDWVLPISSILKSLLYEVGLQEDGSYSVTEFGRFTRCIPGCCPNFVHSYQRTVDRQPLVPGVLPRIFTNPRDMGLWHIITSTALLRQQFTGGRTR